MIEENCSPHWCKDQHDFPISNHRFREKSKALEQVWCSETRLYSATLEIVGGISVQSQCGLPRKGWSWCFSLELSVWGWTGRMPIGCYVEWIHGSVFNMVFKSPSPLLILPFGTLRWYSCSVLLLLPVASLSCSSTPWDCAVCCPPEPQTLAAETVWAFNLGVSETL